MAARPDKALPIAAIAAPADAARADIGPVVSSAHLASGRSPGLSEVEYGMMIAVSAFNRWMVRCMAAAGLPGLSATEVAILHSIAHRGRERRMADIALVLDTACWSKNFDYGSANHRQIGAGPMLVLYDKTLIAPAKLIALAETIARSQGIPLQKDMFSNGGTDGGAIHLSGTGVPTLVLGPPTRHGHCAASIADEKDIHHTQQLLVALVACMNRETVDHLTDFRC